MRERKKRYCIECGAELTSGQQKYCSIDCRKNFENKKKDKYQVLKKSSMPSKQILINDLSLMNITKIGKKYGVSDSAVRKWLKKYNLPSKCNKITSFLKENNYEDKRYRKK